MAESNAALLLVGERVQEKRYSRFLGLKQLTGSEKGPCRAARGQRNHLACCSHAWISLERFAVAFTSSFTLRPAQGERTKLAPLEKPVRAELVKARETLRLG